MARRHDSIIVTFVYKAGLAIQRMRTNQTVNLYRSGTNPRSVRLSALAGLLASLVLLTSCRSSEMPLAGTWKTYHNPRYNFEFPYPSSWTAEPPPDNQDGQAFRDPKNPQAEIRGWAGHQIKPITTKQAQQQAAPVVTSKPNFTTAQGLSGALNVNIGPEISSMTLALQQGDILYHWQARSPSQQFDDYYRFFYYIAQQYRVPPPSQQP